MYSKYSFYPAPKIGTPKFKILGRNGDNRRGGSRIYGQHGVMRHLSRGQEQATPTCQGNGVQRKKTMEACLVVSFEFQHTKDHHV